MKLGRDVGRILVIFSLLLIGYIASAAGVCDPNNIPVIKYASPGDVVYLSVSGLQPNGASTVVYYWTISDPDGAVVYSGTTQSTYSPSIGWQVPEPPFGTSVGFYTVNVLMTPGGLSQSSACIESVCGKIQIVSMACNLQSETICVLDNTQRTYTYNGPTDVNVEWWVDNTQVGSSISETIVWSGYTMGAHSIRENVVSISSGITLRTCTAAVTVVDKVAATGIMAS